jgi:WD40 repeat protein
MRRIVDRAVLGGWALSLTVSLSIRAAAAPSSETTFQPLVPEGEPESLLGVRVEDGLPKFERPPQAERTGVVLEWSPGGKQLEVRRFTQHGGHTTPVAWSPDGRALASVGRHGTALIWDAETGAVLHAIDRPGCASVADMEWSPDGKYLAVGYISGIVRIWDVSADKEAGRVHGAPNSVRSVAWSPDSSSLALAGYNGRVLVWRVQTGKERWQWSDPDVSFYSVTWSPDGRLIAVTGADHSVRVLDAASGRQRQRLLVYSWGSLSAAWSSDSKTISTVADSIKVWDVTSGRLVRDLPWQSFLGSPAIWKPDHSEFTTYNGVIWHWSLGNPRTVPTAVHLVSQDGWVTWRAALDPAHRIIRGENGKLLARQGGGKELQPTAPLIGLHPQLTATARVAASAGIGEPGEVHVDVANAKHATEAVWLEVREPKPFKRNLPGYVSFTFPATTLRLAPGESVTLRVGYSRSVSENPTPEVVKAALALHHAHDGGAEIFLPVTLKFRSPKIVMSTKSPVTRGNEVTVPITVSNVGDQATGSDLDVSAKVWIADSGEVAHTWVQQLEPLAPGAVNDVTLKFVQAVGLGSKLRLELTAAHELPVESSRVTPPVGATEELRAIITKDERTFNEQCLEAIKHQYDPAIPPGYNGDQNHGPRVTWTYRSEWMRPRPWYLGYLAVAAAASIAVLTAAGRFFYLKRRSR